jgi:uncharacterized protein DUF4350
MPVVIPSGDRKLLVFVGLFILLIVAALALLSGEEGEDISFPSSYSAKSHGAKAAYLLLQESGYNLQRWDEPPEKLPKEGEGYLLIVANPTSFPGKPDQEALRRFLTTGGRVLATGFMGGMLLPEGRAAPSPENLGWKPFDALMPSRFTRGGKISLEEAAGWNVESPQLQHYGDDKSAVVVSYPFGKGEVVWWGSASPLTNVGITREKNLDLFLNTIGSRSTRILWDEYFHGSRPSVWSYAWGPALAWGGIQLGVIVMAVMFGFSRRSGPIRSLPQVSRLSPLEFVETLGTLYDRAHARVPALETIYQRFRYLLGKRLGLRSDIDAQEIGRCTRERLGYNNADFVRLLEACEAAIRNPNLSDAQALQLIQSLHQHACNLELIDKPKQENK